MPNNLRVMIFCQRFTSENGKNGYIKISAEFLGMLDLEFTV